MPNLMASWVWTPPDTQTLDSWQKKKKKTKKQTTLYCFRAAQLMLVRDPNPLRHCHVYVEREVSERPWASTALPLKANADLQLPLRHPPLCLLSLSISLLLQLLSAKFSSTHSRTAPYVALSSSQHTFPITLCILVSTIKLFLLNSKDLKKKKKLPSSHHSLLVISPENIYGLLWHPNSGKVRPSSVAVQSLGPPHGYY